MIEYINSLMHDEDMGMDDGAEDSDDDMGMGAE